ncbi:hypothetical protein P8452_47743 [Trifolium repens]|nr:hypothetical protein P8452_47743 [Trifolium repens]
MSEKWEQLESNGVVISKHQHGQQELQGQISNLVLEEEDEDGEDKKTVEVVDEKEIVVVDEKESVVVEEPAVRVQKRAVLQAGSEGEAVQELQEALQTLGFYSGEEDMEFSSFSSGTERAVKTWQSSLGVAGDGIMTSELLEKQYLEKRTADIGNANETKNLLLFYQRYVGLADENESVRDAALGAGHVLVEHYATMYIPLLLPAVEDGIFNDSWRIRQSSVELLGDLSFLNCSRILS